MLLRTAPLRVCEAAARLEFRRQGAVAIDRSGGRMCSDVADREVAHIARTLLPGQLQTVYPRLSADRAQHWEGVLDRARRACGCREGAYGALLGGATALAIVFVARTTMNWQLSAALAAMPAGLIVGALAGRTFGLRRARARAVAAIRSIQAEISAIAK